MDFFAAQDRAKRNTTLLVFLFAAAVISIIVLTHIAVSIAVMMLTQRQVISSAGGEQPGMFDPFLMLAVAGGVLAVIGIGTSWKLLSLRGGGRSVAELLGGRLIDPLGPKDADERKVQNVVEEMAIASGIPVPPVYVMDDEKAINAFAAGWSPRDAAIGVTRGSIQILSRDELQGVMAHEFSHILNGDMRLNIRLIGVLNGILIIGLTGYGIVRSLRYAAFAGSTRRSNSKGGGGGAILVILGLGVALIVIGYIGVFFGKLIKAAVSRQREFLADAAAVQFTRYPDGIAGALKKIGGLADGSHLHSPKAEELSHMYTAEGVTFASSMLSTHPPLPERILRLDPNWDGKFPKIKSKKSPKQRENNLEGLRKGTAGKIDARQLMQIGAGVAAGGAGGALDGAVASIGRPTADHLDYARALLAKIPDAVKNAAREGFGSRAVVYLLLLDRGDMQVRSKQWSLLSARALDGVVREARTIEPMIRDLDPAARLPLLDMCIPSLKEISRHQYEEFTRIVGALIAADDRVDLFEWVLRRLLEQHLGSHFQDAKPPAVQYYNLRRLGKECSQLLSVLAHAGHAEDADASSAFGSGAARLSGVDMKLSSRESCRDLDGLDGALTTLNTVALPEKRNILLACAATIAWDKEITVEEGELLRAIADTLGCPMPPLLPGQSL